MNQTITIDNIFVLDLYNEKGNPSRLHLDMKLCMCFQLPSCVTRFHRRVGSLSAAVTKRRFSFVFPDKRIYRAFPLETEYPLLQKLFARRLKRNKKRHIGLTHLVIK